MSEPGGTPEGGKGDGEQNPYAPPNFEKPGGPPPPPQPEGQPPPYGQPAGYGQPPPYGAPPGYGVPTGAKPDNYLIVAILTTLLCCLPLGIVSIVYASQVNSKYAAGDYAGATAASAKAKQFAIYSAVAGLLVVAIAFAVGPLAGS